MKCLFKDNQDSHNMKQREKFNNNNNTVCKKHCTHDVNKTISNSY